LGKPARGYRSSPRELRDLRTQLRVTIPVVGSVKKSDLSSPIDGAGAIYFPTALDTALLHLRRLDSVTTSRDHAPLEGELLTRLRAHPGLPTSLAVVRPQRVHVVCYSRHCAAQHVDAGATYSARNAITGSTREARNPGTQLANTAVTASTTTMDA
jgi:hypothetical protein